MAKAAAATALLDRNLNALDGSNVRTSTSTGTASTAIRSLGNDSEGAGKQIDRLSGRLAIFAQAAAVLGPALVPLGAATVPVLGALTAGLGAAAGALGVTLLASQGLGDAFEALNAAQLEPTTENIAAMRAEFEKIGPAGEQFVRYIDSLAPALSELQMTARSGLFPGVEEGIDSLLERTPQITTMVRSLSAELGDLARDSGDALASDKFDAFFDYLANEAGPLLSDFGRIAGNVFETVANVLVALDPATQSFTDGLLDKTRELAQWSRDLGSNDSFQSFLDYIQESGPKAVEFVGALVTSLADIAVAVAPIGDAVLPVLTSLVGLLGDIASSDIGTPIFAGVAALSVYNRALATTTALQARMSTAGTLGGAGAMFGIKGLATEADKGTRSLSSLASAAGRAALPIAGIAVATSGAADGIGLTNTASLGLLGTLGGGWGAALGTAAGFTLDLAHANDDLQASIDAAKGATGDDPLADLLAKRNTLVREFAEVTNAGGLSGAIGRISSAFGQDRLETEAAIESIDSLIAARRRLDALPDQDPLDGLNALFGELNGTIVDSTSLMYDFADAASAAMGFLDRRAAMRNYEESLDAVNAALEENGRTLDVNTPKGRANQEVLDQIGRSALIAAENLKGNNRRTFLDDLRGNLRAAAEDLGANDKQIHRLLDSLGLLDQKKVEPEVDLQDGDFTAKQQRAMAQLRKLDLDHADPEVNLLIGKFLAGNENALRKLRALSREKAEPTADLNANPFDAVFGGTMGNLRTLDRGRADPLATLNDQASGPINNVASRLRALDGQVANTSIVTTYRTVGRAPTASGGGFDAGYQSSADGSTVPRDGGPYRDYKPYLLAGGEEVISNRYGQADRHRSLLKAINAGALANGGTAGDMSSGSQTWASFDAATWADRQLREFGGSARWAAAGLRDEREARVKLLTSEQEANKERISNLRAEAQAIRSSITSRLESDIFARYEGPSPSTEEVAVPDLTGLSGDARRAALEKWRADTIFQDNLNNQIIAAQNRTPADILRDDIARAQTLALQIQQLTAKGLDGGALQALLAGGDDAQIAAYASGSRRDVQTYERLFDQRAAIQTRVGQEAVVGSGIAAELRVARAEAKETNVELKTLNRRMERIEKRLEKAPDDTGKAVGREINSAATKGQKDRRSTR